MWLRDIAHTSSHTGTTLATLRGHLLTQVKPLLMFRFCGLAGNGYNVVVANLPAKMPTELSDDAVERVAEGLNRGLTVAEIARRAHPDDRIARQRLRRKLEAYALMDQRIVARTSQKAQLELLAGLGPATRALVARASRGRPDAIKLLFEASGFHNPKSRVEHSGEIKIKLDMPRPTFNEPDGIVDAEVVD